MKNKTQQKEILAKLKKKLDDSGATRGEIVRLQAMFAEVIKTMNERMATQLITKIDNEVSVKDLPAMLEKLLSAGVSVSNFPEFPKSFDVAKVAEISKPSWWEAPHKSVGVKGTVSVKVENQDQGKLMEVMVGAIGEVIRFMASAVKGIFQVKMVDSDFLKPQTFALFNPYTKQYVDPDKLFTVTNLMGPGGGASISVSGGGASSVSFKGASGIQSGTLTVTTSGTKVQFPNVPCSSVLVQAHEDNALLNNLASVAAVIGGSGVVALSASRSGIALYPTNSQLFNVANTNLLYVDATDNGAKVTYTVLS